MCGGEGSGFVVSSGYKHKAQKPSGRGLRPTLVTLTPNQNVTNIAFLPSFQQRRKGACGRETRFFLFLLGLSRPCSRFLLEPGRRREVKHWWWKGFAFLSREKQLERSTPVSGPWLCTSKPELPCSILQPLLCVCRKRRLNASRKT